MSRQDALITADWAEENLGTPGVVFVEVDEDTTVYDGGHIPGAVRIDWRTELQDQVRRDVVDRAGFEALLSDKGIANDDTVVLYGGNNNWFAAYAYWYFTLYGHPAVRLLDGGRKKWELDGRRLDTAVPARPRTTYTAREQDRSIRAFRDEVVDAIGTASLIDIRSPEEYAGRLLAPAHLPQEQAQRGGHIPGAVNIPWSRAVAEDGTFRSDDDLRALYGGAGIDRDTRVITYCRIGERSSHTWFALHELLDHPEVKNYDGSWTEYGSLVGVPVQTGDERGSAVAPSRA
ncbi:MULTISPECIES: sulfurtransferase [unclassified Pseudonocardia]|uniref:sulfurtransferase n=1 Tax=unclassified Pseudonocardia TaxID=2619320 RepID=UPI001CF6A41E|nr:MULTISPECIES: sulfurtransferase [unclassified Pseudonocardia]